MRLAIFGLLSTCIIQNLLTYEMYSKTYEDVYLKSTFLYAFTLEQPSITKAENQKKTCQMPYRLAHITKHYTFLVAANKICAICTMNLNITRFTVNFVKVSMPV